MARERNQLVSDSQQRQHDVQGNVMLNSSDSETWPFDTNIAELNVPATLPSGGVSPPRQQMNELAQRLSLVQVPIASHCCFWTLLLYKSNPVRMP